MGEIWVLEVGDEDIWCGHSLVIVIVSSRAQKWDSSSERQDRGDADFHDSRRLRKGLDKKVESPQERTNQTDGLA